MTKREVVAVSLNEEEMKIFYAIKKSLDTNKYHSLSNSDVIKIVLKTYADIYDKKIVSH